MGPEDINVPINKVTDVLFPFTRDPEGLIVNVTHSMKPEFTTFDGIYYHIEPINVEGKFEVQGYITDGTYFVGFTFNIWVIN